jgi:hypothetical protein
MNSQLTINSVGSLPSYDIRIQLNLRVDSRPPHIVWNPKAYQERCPDVADNQIIGFITLINQLKRPEGIE